MKFGKHILSGFLTFSLFCALMSAQQGSSSSGTASIPRQASSSVTTTGGVVNTLPLWTTGTNIQSSAITQTGTGSSAKIGINTTTPAAALDVKGGETLRGVLYIAAKGGATATAGQTSQPLDLAASSFSSTLSTPVNQTFQWLAEPAANNTANPSGTLNLLYGLGSTTPSETGLKVSSKGLFTFASGQAFPGTAGLTSNTFNGNQSVTGNISATGSISGATLSGNGASVTNVNAAALNGFGASSFAFVSGNNTFFGSQTLAPAFPAAALTFADDGVSGDLQPSLLVNAIDCCTFGDRMIWAHSPSFPAWGILYDDSGFDGSADTMHWQRSTGSDVMSIEFETGNLNVAGAITAGVKDFKIDHPLDPKNKYLYHSSVESSEMMNIYTGNAILDNSGDAMISLPKWFEALNTDFRYQLTSVGAPAPNLHVAQEIAQHQFSIAGGAPGMKVSWQVTGVRQDAFAKAHPLAVEVRKPEKERGRYLHPEAYGAPRLTQEQMLAQGSR
jgi:hypothetical protein